MAGAILKTFAARVEDRGPGRACVCKRCCMFVFFETRYLTYRTLPVFLTPSARTPFSCSRDECKYVMFACLYVCICSCFVFCRYREGRYIGDWN